MVIKSNSTALRIGKSFVAIILVLFFSNIAIFGFGITWVKGNVHEKLSRQSLLCAANSTSLLDTCSNSLKGIQKEIDLIPGNLQKIDIETIEKIVRWSDDPLNELLKYNVMGWIRFVTQIKFSECENKTLGLQDGLRCSSHFGPLQFLHSMESEKNIPITDTQTKILDWMEFNYKIITEPDPTNPGKFFANQDFCTYFQNNGSSISSKFYTNLNTFPCSLVNKRWRLATIYSFTCNTQTTHCWEKLDDDTPRLNAIGAILHAIQDSYAKGHTSRSGSSGNLNEYDCAKITRFHVYNGQNHDKHEEADKEPKENPNTCNGKSQIHDPITAGANVLLMIKNKTSASYFRKYLEQRVFAVEGKNLSSQGDGF